MYFPGQFSQSYEDIIEDIKATEKHRKLKVSELLKQRLINELNLELTESDYLESVHPGCWQREAGAFSWVIRGNLKYHFYGSAYTMKELLKAPKLELYKQSNYLTFIEPCSGAK